MKTIKNLTADKIRKSILQLAIQGKLVKQDPNDEPASELVKRIYEEKQKLIKEGKIKKDKNESYIYKGDDNCYYEKIGNEIRNITDELPFEIPDSWTWIKLKNLVNIETGKKDANFGGLEGNYDFFTCALEPIKAKSYSYDGEYLILPGNGANVGKSIHYFGKFEAYQRTYLLSKLFNDVNFDYLKINLDARWFEYNKDKLFGSAIPYIKLSNIADFLIPLPPIYEQKNIVTKIFKIEPFIKQYQLIATDLSKYESSFEEKLKASILQYAIEGKLVKQDPNDEPASKLLERIKFEKEKLIQEGKIKRDKHESEIFVSDDKNYYEKLLKDDAKICIPQSWELVNLSNISIIQEGAGIRSYQYRSEGIHLLTVTNILDGSIDQNISKKYVNYDEFLSKYKHLKLKKGDIVTACSGGSWGKSAIFNLDEEFMLNTSTLRLRFFGDKGDNNYLYTLTKSAFFKNQLLKQLSGMQPNFGYSHYRKVIVPVPPLEEQQRIVAKLKKIFYQFC